MGDQTAQFTEEYCAEKMKIIALIIALLVAVAASSEISGDSNERVVPEESLVATSDDFVPAVHHLVKKHVKSVKNLFSKVKGLAKKGKKGAIKKLIKKHVSKLKRRVIKHAKRHHKSLVKKHAKKGKKGAIKKLIKKHVRKLKRRVNKHVKWHFRRGRSSRRSRRSSRRSRRSSRRSGRSIRRSGRSIRQRGTKWECSWNHNPWFPCTPRPGDVVVPPYNGYWTKRHRKRSRKRRRL